MKKYILLMLISISYLNAMVFGGTNLYSGYPNHSCYKPFKPYSFSSQFQLNNYNNDLDRYYKCLKEYIENANNDIKRIQERQQEIIDSVKYGY